MRSSKARSRAKAAGALAFTLMLNGLPVVMAQTPAPVAPPAIPAPPGLGTTAPATAATGPVRTLTLSDVVALAVNNNSSVILARQRLQRSQYQIDATNAQALPQVSASLADTYDSQKSFGTSGSSVSTPTLAGGGTIPTITDQGGGTTSTFVGGGGGGTAASNGSSSNTGATSAPATNSGSNVSVTSPGGLNGTGTTSGTGGTGTTGTGGTGATGTVTVPGANTGTTGTTGTTGAGGGTAAGAQAVPREGLPPIAQKYASVADQSFTPVPSRAAQSRAIPRAGGTGTTGGSAGGGTGNGTTGGTSSGSSGQYNNYSGRVTATQYIDIFGLVPTTRDVEKITREFYQIDLQRVQNETALAAKDDFFTALRDQAQVAVDQEQVNAAAANLRITQIRQIAGTAAEADVLNAQVSLSNDQQAQNTAQNTLNLALANLDNLLGISPETNIALQPPPLPSLTASVDLQQSTQLALKQRPELEQAENNITIANKLIRLAGATLLPTLGISGVASYAGNVSPGGTHDDYTITAQINIPLYDGGYTRAQVNTAKVDLATQLTTRDQLRQNVILEVKQAYLDILNDQAGAASAAVGVTSAREAARIAGLQYQYGTNTFLNLLNAQAQLAVAETDYYNDEFSYQTDLATLVRAIGGR